MTTTYTVRQNDTLTAIAKAHNTTVLDLARLNKISDPNRIHVGQKIIFSETPTQENPQLENEEVTVDTLSTQLEAAQQQLADLQGQISQQDNGLTDMERFGIGLGATYASYKMGKGALPYVKTAGKYSLNQSQKMWNLAKNTYTSAKESVQTTAMRAKESVKSATKHAAKKAELEYAFAKDAVKTNVTQAKVAVKNTASKVGDNATKVAKNTSKATKKTFVRSSRLLKGQKVSVAGKAVKSLGKAGKFLGKGAVPLQAGVAIVEVTQAYDKGGTKAAVKQAAKSGSGIAGGLAGAKVGAALGTAICPGLGTVIGGFVGGIAGYIAGENLADKVIS